MDKLDIYRKRMTAVLKEFGNSTDSERNELAGLFDVVHIPKKTSVIRPGENTDKVYFIIKGMVRIYYYKNRKEITNQFMTEDHFFAPVYHMFTGKENPNYYQAMEDTIALAARYSDMERLYARSHNLEHTGRKLIEFYYAVFLKQSYDLMFLTAEERYNIFVRENPELLKRLPLRHIASYLGIQHETLSRIRAANRNK